MLNQYLILTMLLIGEIEQEVYYPFKSTKLELRETESLNDFIRCLQYTIMNQIQDKMHYNSAFIIRYHIM